MRGSHPHRYLASSCFALLPPLSATTKHGHPTSQESNLVSTLDCHSYPLSLINNLSLSLDRARFPSFSHQTADLGHHTEITLQDVPNREYTLRLFLENEEREIQKTDNRSWTPVQRQYARYFLARYTHRTLYMYRDVSSISKIRAELQMRSGHSFWAKIRQKSDTVDIQELLKEYWDSTEHELTIPSQSQRPECPLVSDRGAQRPLRLESTMDIWSCGSLPTPPSVSLRLPIPTSF